jgi:hypothetical protein
MWPTLLFAQVNPELSEDVSMVPFAIFSIIMLIGAFVTVVAMWKVFVKAGKPGWACLIPFYNILMTLNIIGRPAWYLVFIVIPGANIVLLVILAFGLARSFGKGIPFAIGMVLFAPLFIMVLGFGKARYVGPMGPNYRRGPKIPQTT